MWSKILCFVFVETKTDAFKTKLLWSEITFWQLWSTNFCWLSIFVTIKIALALSAVQTNLTSGWLWNEKLFPLFTVFNINTPTNLPLFFLLIVCLSTLRRLEQSEITSSLFLSYYARCDWVVSLLYDPPKFLVMYRHIFVTLMANKRVRHLKTLTTRLKCANNWQLKQKFRTGSIFFSPTPVIWRTSAWLEMVCWQ